MPEPPAVPAEPVQALCAHHDGHGVWLGEALDVGWAIDVLHPLRHAGGG